jgi:competence protein ComEA
VRAYRGGVDHVDERQRVRVRARVGAVIVLVLVGLGCAVLVSVVGDHGSTSQVARPSPGASATPVGGAIFVHILGAVTRPGLYELREGDRAIDAVAAAGGFTDAADQSQLNLARFVADGEQIVVPAVGEAPAGGAVASDGRVNINTADAAALDTLPRVGPAMAQRIIAWREANGAFTAIDDLLGVPGIGDKTLEGLRELVTL